MVGKKFAVKTDHNSLRHFLGQQEFNDRQKKSGSARFVQAYDFDIVFVKGKKNTVADALSRKPHLCAIRALLDDWRELIMADYARDDWASSIIDGTI